MTPLGQAVQTALELVRTRKNVYRQNGIAYYRPWVFLLTDGEPTDAWQGAAKAIRLAEEQKSLAFFAVGVAEANMDILAQLAVRTPLSLDGLRFAEMFSWLSTSLRSVSHSSVSDEVALANPAVPSGWAKV